MAIAIALVVIVVAPALVAAFGGEPAVTASAVTGLRIISLGFPFYAYAMVLTNSFNGAGDTLTPTVINVFCFWLWELPLAYTLAIVLGLGPRGVFLAIMIAFSTLAFVSAFLFRKGRWKTRVV